MGVRHEVNQLGSVVPPSYLLTSDVFDQMPGDIRIPARVGEEPELAWCASGTLTVHTARHRIALAAGSGVWLPASEPRSYEIPRGSRAGMTLVTPTALPSVAGPTLPVPVPAAVSELLVFMHNSPMDPDRRRRAQQLCLELSGGDDGQVQDSPCHVAAAVPVPSDPRIAPLARLLIDDPAHPMTLPRWARATGFSASTLARLFRDETGMSFSTWRGALKLQTARSLLARGMSVQRVARTVGYSSASSFVAAYRRVTGGTPGKLRNHPDRVR